MNPAPPLRLNSIPEEPCHYPDGETKHPVALVRPLHANMQESLCFEDLDTKDRPFNDAAYRQWEKEFDRKMNNKPLPPLPRVSLPATTQIVQPGPERITAVSHTKPHQSVQGELFPPLQHPQPMRSPWERQAQKIIVRREEGVKERSDAEFKSIWSPVTIDEDRKIKGCCCVM